MKKLILISAWVLFFGLVWLTNLNGGSKFFGSAPVDSTKNVLRGGIVADTVEFTFYDSTANVPAIPQDITDSHLHNIQDYLIADAATKLSFIDFNKQNAKIKKLLAKQAGLIAGIESNMNILRQRKQFTDSTLLIENYGQVVTISMDTSFTIDGDKVLRIIKKQDSVHVVANDFD